jgi:ATPase subunit of ABC transporter with duplicated ATPase domains
VRGNVMEGVAAKKAKLDRFNELAMNYSDETAEEMAELQDEIDSQNLWDLDAQIDVAMEALRCPPDDASVDTLSGGERAASRSASCCSKRPTCCCSTNRPTTSTPKPSPGCSST